MSITEETAVDQADVTEPTPDALPALMQNRGTDVAVSLDERLRVAELLSESGMLPDTYRGKRGNVLAAEFAADALQIPLFTAFQHLHNVKGRVGLSAELMRSLVRRAGHRYKLSGDRTKATMVIHLRGEREPEAAVEFTLEDAVDAGLVSLHDGKPRSRSERGEKKPWESHTRSMLQARVTSLAVRMHCPEVLAGMSYTPDELDEIADSEGRITATVQQVPTPQQRAAPPAESKPVEPSDPEREPWTPETLLLELASVDPADPDLNVELRFRRYWNEAQVDGIHQHVVDGKPIGAHVLAAQATVKRGQMYVPVVDVEVVDPEGDQS